MLANVINNISLLRLNNIGLSVYVSANTLLSMGSMDFFRMKRHMLIEVVSRCEFRCAPRTLKRVFFSVCSADVYCAVSLCGETLRADVAFEGFLPSMRHEVPSHVTFQGKFLAAHRTGVRFFPCVSTHVHLEESRG